MLLASKSLLRCLSLNSLVLFGENRSNETPGVPSNTSHAFGKEGATSIAPFTAVVLEEHPVSNGNVWKLEKHLVVVRRWELQEAAEIWKNRTLPKDPQANPRIWVLPVSKWWL